MRLDGPTLQRRTAAARRGRAPSALERDLRQAVEGEVRFDGGHRAAYSHDASNHRQAPLGVVVPRTVADVIAAVDVARSHGAPVLPRGGGTGLAGATVNAALVIDASKHLTRVLDVDPDARLARVEPGVVRDHLARAALPHGLTFGPDTSTHAVATLGGMLGHNSCGVHSLTAGRTSDNTHELEVLLYDGRRMTVGRGAAPAEIKSRLEGLRDRHAGAIRRGFPELPRRVSGYNLDELLPERGFHVARALVGSEGTLAIILGATVHLVEQPPYRALAVLGFPSVADAADRVGDVLEHGPSGLEGMDATLLGDLRRLVRGDGWLLAEFARAGAVDAATAARRCAGALAAAADTVVLEDAAAMLEVWRTRERALGQASYVAGEPDRLPGWEDAAVPPARLGAYLRAFTALIDRYGYRTALYGHFGDGCVHCRISFDLGTPAGTRAARRFLDEAADLVVAHGGSLSGEHGDGLARGELLPKMFGPQLMGAFKELKDVFDPGGRMNPHRGPVEPATVTAHLKDPVTAARVRCVGAGICRDTTGGTMCPSYMVTRDEQHCTRGRARILHELLEGAPVVTGGHRSEEVREALDLCLSCKACKSECPVGVDMAAYKAEFLSRHFRRRRRPAAAYSMGLIGFHAPLAARAPRLANAFAGTAVAKRAAGIARERPVPAFARSSFRAWWAVRPPVNRDGPSVVLFADTFGDFFHPQVLAAAARALEAAGFHVRVPPRACCGRPLYDFGMLKLAERRLRGLVEAVGDGADPVVVVEPSCLSTFKDELPARLPHDPAARRLSTRATTLARLLLHAPSAIPPPPRSSGRPVLLHGHCHQRATIGLDAEAQLLRSLGMDVDVLDAGCCGMAGAFGFQREHLEVSRRIGERRLLPAVRSAAPEALLVADGFSCRTQVEHFTDRRGRHLAEILAGPGDCGA